MNYGEALRLLVRTPTGLLQIWFACWCWRERRKTRPRIHKQHEHSYWLGGDGDSLSRMIEEARRDRIRQDGAWRVLAETSSGDAPVDARRQDLRDSPGQDPIRLPASGFDPSKGPVAPAVTPVNKTQRTGSIAAASDGDSHHRAEPASGPRFGRNFGAGRRAGSSRRSIAFPGCAPRDRQERGPYLRCRTRRGRSEEGLDGVCGAGYRPHTRDPGPRPRSEAACAPGGSHGE